MAFLYLSWKYLADGLPGYRDLMLLMAAFAVHVNYLMWMLWFVAGLVVLLGHVGYRHKPAEMIPVTSEDAEWHEPTLELIAPDHVALKRRPTLVQLVRIRRFWWGLIAAILVASPWYIRNIIVTRNPVYAFFTNVFTGSIKVNPEVMRSAEQEWLLNGDGLGRVGQTLGEKLANSWLYFVTGPHHWKMGPFLVAFVLPGVVVFLGWLLIRLSRKQSSHGTGTDPADDALLRFGAASLFLFLFLWAYAYVIADFYLYQIVIVIALFPVFAAFVYRICSTPATKGVLHTLVLLLGFAPGVIMGLMGFKLMKTGIYEGLPAPQFALTALKKLFIQLRCAAS